MTSKRILYRGKAVISWGKAAYQIILCADGGGRGRRPDGNLDSAAVIRPVLALGVVSPSVEMPLQGLSQSS